MRPDSTDAGLRSSPERDAIDRAMSGTEHHLRVTRTARYWSAGGGAGNASEVWFVCHGYGQLAGRFLSRFESIADDSRLVVAPEALNRFYLDQTPGPHGPESRVGATWMTREDRLVDIDDYTAWLDTLYQHVAASEAGRRIVALGFSQGTATVARWVNRTRHRIDDVVLWSGGLPPELEPSAALFGGATLTLVAGEADRMVGLDAMRRQAERLHAAGRQVQLVVHVGGHRVDPDAAAILLGKLREVRSV